MSTKHTITPYFQVILPILLAGSICFGLIYYLQILEQSNPTFAKKLIDLAPVFIGISVLFVLAIMGYLYHSVLIIKKKNATTKGILKTATQKMHNVRRIIEILMGTKMWLPGLKEFIDEEFRGLTYFEVKDFYKGKSKLAIEFLQENHDFLETENLYLEMKSMLLTQPNQGKLPSSISYPKTYNTPIIEHWLQHKIGAGLWYFFGYKYTSFKVALDLEAVLERHQDKIMSLAMAIDPETFEENSFNEVFLSKLGEYITKNILPNLYKERTLNSKIIPRRIQLITLLLIFLIVFGLLMPIASLLLDLPIILLIMSYAFVCGLLCYFSFSFYQFLKYEMTH